MFVYDADARPEATLQLPCVVRVELHSTDAVDERPILSNMADLQASASGDEARKPGWIYRLRHVDGRCDLSCVSVCTFGSPIQSSVFDKYERSAGGACNEAY